jgi:hypothetical protein
VHARGESESRKKFTVAIVLGDRELCPANSTVSREIDAKKKSKWRSTCSFVAGPSYPEEEHA